MNNFNYLLKIKVLSGVLKSLFMILFLTGIMIVFTEGAGAVSGNIPEFQVVRPVAVIKVSPLNISQEYWAENELNNTENINITGNNHLQKNMQVRWHNNAERQENIYFKVNDLVLQNEKPKAQMRRFGFFNIRESSTPFIPAEMVMMSKYYSNDYYSLGEWQHILSPEENVVELEFKLDEEILANKWFDLPPGIYRGDIETNINVQGRSPHVIVIMESAAEISLNNENLKLQVSVPTRPLLDMDDGSNKVGWKITTNSNQHNLQFKSVGNTDGDYGDLTETTINDFFRYVISDNFSDDMIEFSPGEKASNVNFREGTIKIEYSPEYSEKKWNSIRAGNYQDIIEITVSS